MRAAILGLLVVSLAASSVACTAETSEEEGADQAALTAPKASTTRVTPQGVSGKNPIVRYAANGAPQVLFAVETDRINVWDWAPRLRFGELRGSAFAVETIPDGAAMAWAFSADATGHPQALVFSEGRMRTALTLWTRGDTGTWSPEGVDSGAYLPGTSEGYVRTGLAPSIVYAKDGTPHVAYRRENVRGADGTSVTQIVHAVREGQAWRHEVVEQWPQWTALLAHTSLLIASDGLVHVVYGGATLDRHATLKAGAWKIEDMPAGTSQRVALDRTARLASLTCEANGALALTTFAPGKAPAKDTFVLASGPVGACTAKLDYDTAGRPHVAVARETSLEYAVKEKSVWKTYVVSSEGSYSAPSLAIRNRGGFQVGIAQAGSNSLGFSALSF
jgi:hypothetical protein